MCGVVDERGRVGCGVWRPVWVCGMRFLVGVGGVCGVRFMGEGSCVGWMRKIHVGLEGGDAGVRGGFEWCVGTHQLQFSFL